MNRGGYDQMEGYNAGKDSSSSTTGNLCYFSVLILIIQGLGLTAVILVAVWMGHYLGGFAWQEDPGKEFNYHPVFMIIGLIFLYANAILSYRVFRNMKKIYIKVIHASIQAGALIFAGVGLKAVFDSHNLRVLNGKVVPIPNLYSLHSWIGLTTVVLFGLQWVCGFTSYLFPKVGLGLRTMYMPHHIFWGLAIFGCAVCSALTGITEKALFLMSGKQLDYANLPGEGVLINCLGVTILLLAGFVFYVATRPEYKRPAQPEEDEHIQLAHN